MGFLGNIITAVVKVAVMPVTIAMDIVVAPFVPDRATHTKYLLKSASKDVEKAIDSIT